MTEQLLTGKEVARLLSIGYSTVFKYASDGTLPCVRLGRLVRFRLTDVQRLIEAGTLPAVQPD